jgi:hypothetical protein
VTSLPLPSNFSAPSPNRTTATASCSTRKPGPGGVWKAPATPSQAVNSVTNLLIAHTSTRPHPDTLCAVHGGPDDIDQEADDHNQDQDDDPKGRADLEAQYTDASL